MEFKLILKKIEGTLSPEEQIIFDNWYLQSQRHRDYFHRVTQMKQPIGDIYTLKAYEKISKRLYRRKPSKLYYKIAAAALLLILISLPFVTNKNNQKFPPSTNEITKPSQTPILIGTDKAVLTLEDGSEIALEKDANFQNNYANSNGKELVYTSSSKNNNTSSIAYNTLSIPRGGQFYIVLSDGTKVWLNSETKLKYPVTFSLTTTRKVELVYGEAYFEVSPSTMNQGQGFTVITQGQEVEVLGTQFNIKAYQDDNYIATTLVEGKVRIVGEQTSIQLQPGMQSKQDINSSKIQSLHVDIYNEISWKEGFFSFKNKPLKDIVKQLSRWYNIDIEIHNEKAAELEFNGVFNKHQKLENILNIIENTNEAKFEKKGTKIIMK